MKKYIYITLTLILAWSCSKLPEDIERRNSESQFTFTVQMQGLRLPQTRAMTADAENTVASIDILAFEVGGDMSEKFAYTTKALSIADDQSSEKKIIKAKLIKAGDKNYRFVLLANLSDTQTNALSNASVGILKEDLLASILYENTQKWNIDPVDFTPIPMWGESGVLLVNDQLAATGINGVKLIRMTARVDVIVNPEAQSKFILETVYFYNFNTVGRIAPSVGAWDAINNTVIAPSTPLSPATSPTPQVYTVENPDDQKIINTIYAFEAAAGSESQADKAVSIVVGGRYNNSAAATYYRIDFLESDRSKFMDILRNHLYRINITEVSAQGYTTPSEAFSAKSVNLKSNVIVWNYSETGYLTFNDQYILGVNKEKFTFARDVVTTEDQNNKLIIITDNPQGWKVDHISYTTGQTSGWLSLDQNSGAANVKASISLLLDVNSDITKPERTSYIHLSAGRLTKIITVNQSRNRALSIDILDSEGLPITELIFNNYDGITSINPQGYKVVWRPHGSGYLINYSLFHVGALPLFDFGSGEQIPATGQLADLSGTFSYTNIKPNPFPAAEIAEDGTGNPFLEKAADVEYLVEDEGISMAKHITIRQVNHAAVPVVDNAYVMDGNEQSFRIKSNSSWKVTLVSDPQNVLNSFSEATGGYEQNIGQQVKFTLVNDISPTPIHGSAEITFRVECTNPERYFPSKDFTINCVSGVIREESNCYILGFNSMAILIPVDRANKSTILGNQQIKSTDVIEGKLIWTDNPLGISANSNIKFITSSGLGNSGYVVVVPGNFPGNAVVGVTVNGVVKWSWHIWTTDYEPEGVGFPAAVWMDRNLGANGNTVGNANSYGLYYQWGRKDPFPGSQVPSIGTANIESSARRIYNDKGVELTYGTIPNTKNGTGINFLLTIVEDNLKNAVENPMYYYSTYTTAPTDWFTNNKDKIDNTLWGDASGKTIYDPCPEGWRVPMRDAALNYADSPFHWGNNTANINSLTGTAGQDKPRWMGGANYGIEWNNKGGYYPAAGAYNVTAAALRLTTVGTQGIYACATPVGGASTNVYRFIFSSASSIPSQQSTRQNTYNVRCVKE